MQNVFFFVSVIFSYMTFVAVFLNEKTEEPDEKCMKYYIVSAMSLSVGHQCPRARGVGCMKYYIVTAMPLSVGHQCPRARGCKIKLISSSLSLLEKLVKNIWWDTGAPQPCSKN